MKLFLPILCLVVLCSFAIYYVDQVVDSWANNQLVQPAYQIQIITNQEAKLVMDYHGILAMRWSIPHKDFIFERNGKICRARAFEIIKEGK